MQTTAPFQASFTALGSSTYLVLTPEDPAMLVNYCVEMGQRNRIPGLLTMHRETVDGELRLCYDITGRQKLTAKGPLDPKQGERLFAALVRSLQGMNEFFLGPEQCLLDPEYLFVDRHLVPQLPLLPLRGREAGGRGLKDFLLAAIGCLGGEGAYFDRLLKVLIRPDFDFESFASLALPPKAEVQPTPQRPAPLPERPAAAPPVPRTEMREEEKPPAPPTGGFAIPGGIGIPAVGGKKEKKEKPPKVKAEKKPRFPGLPFGRSKKKEVPPPLDMEREAHVVVPQAQPDKPQAERPPVGEPAAPPPAEWRGTVMEDLGRTEFDGGEEGPELPALLHRGRRIPMEQFPFTLGSANSSYNLDNPRVSHAHAKITRQEGGYYIQDENSLNHTYVDGVMLPPYTPHPLRPGAVILLAGREELVFTCGGGPR